MFDEKAFSTSLHITDKPLKKGIRLPLLQNTHTRTKHNRS